MNDAIIQDSNENKENMNDTNTEDFIAILGADGAMEFEDLIIEDLDFDESSYDNVVVAQKPNSDLPLPSILSKDLTDSSSKQPECSQIAKPGKS